MHYNIAVICGYNSFESEAVIIILNCLMLSLPILNCVLCYNYEWSLISSTGKHFLLDVKNVDRILPYESIQGFMTVLVPAQVLADCDNVFFNTF